MPYSPTAATSSSSSISTANIPPPGSAQPTNTGNWKTVSSKRKGSPIKRNSVDKQTKLTRYWLSAPASTSNQFDGLDEVENVPSAAPEPKPPPIFINDVQNIAPLRELLQQIAPDGYSMKIINSNNVKIMCKSKELYSSVINSLTEKSTKFHTYQLKENRAFRVVLRHVHHTTDIEEIKKEFQLIGHSVRNIHVVIQRGTKLPLPMFYVDLEPSPNNKDIYNIDLFMNLKVKIEPPRQKREIVQCTKCQRYGHTKHFCFNNARCVKCVGNHATESCKRDNTNEQVQCVLCNGNHPANYKGCEIYKQLQAKQYPRLRQRTAPQAGSIENPRSPEVHPNISYAQAVRNPHQQQSEPHSSSRDNTTLLGTSEHSSNQDMVELKKMMKVLIEQMGNMMNLLTIIVSKLNN